MAAFAATRQHVARCWLREKETIREIEERSGQVSLQVVGPEMLTLFFGEERCRRVVSVRFCDAGRASGVTERQNSGFEPDVLPKLAKLDHLKHISIASARLHDPDLKALVNVKALKSVWIADAPITGAGLAELAKVSRLEHLDLHNAALKKNDLLCLVEFESLGRADITGWMLADCQSELERIRRVRPKLEVSVGAFTLGTSAEHRSLSAGLRAKSSSIPSAN